MKMQAFETRAATFSCLLVAAIGLILGSADAAAATPGWYAGFATGRTVVNESVGLFASDNSSEQQGFLLRGGYRISGHFAIELGHTRATAFDWSPVGFAAGADLPSFSELSHVNFDVSSLQLGAVGILPFGRIWEAYAKLGLVRYRSNSHQRIREWSFEEMTFTRDVTRDVTVAKRDRLRAIGIGANVSERWHVRLELHWFRLSDRVVGVARFGDSDLTVDSWTLGFDRRF
jgi:hypothetical protein